MTSTLAIAVVNSIVVVGAVVFFPSLGCSKKPKQSKQTAKAPPKPPGMPDQKGPALTASSRMKPTGPMAAPSADAKKQAETQAKNADGKEKAPEEKRDSKMTNDQKTPAQSKVDVVAGSKEKVKSTVQKNDDKKAAAKGKEPEEMKDPQPGEELKEEKKHEDEYPDIKEPTQSMKKRREVELEKEKREGIEKGIYQSKSDEDDTLEPIKSLKEERSEDVSKSKK
ncbi:hypothetical protein QR680_007747 [Steinernema hermaphroditum]|uniref:Uncharacterized protein n=1 Tax=Steinernema hermaphroditum TaxID=289476 RepID=A0AA39IGB2_9BILA|nr:hypothetical protein QR680_007747 [Steinernema hermaphroditum]